MNPKEELTKLLTDSYDKGVEDAKQAAIIALEETVAVMVAQEREECVMVCIQMANRCDDIRKAALEAAAEAIRARGTI